MINRICLLYYRLVCRSRLKFGRWVVQEQLGQKCVEALKKTISNFPDTVSQYLVHCTGLPKAWVEQLDWDIALYLFSAIRNKNAVSKIPLLMPSKQKDADPVPWDYEGRSLSYWTHLLAKNYGWTVEYVYGLDVDVALRCVQEILVNEQLDREFAYSLSEIAYPYNSSTKKSEFKPMSRPYFMWRSAPEIKKIRIRKDLIPAGVVDVSGMAKYFEEEKTKYAQ